MIKYTRAQILENRWIWINFLKSIEALKGIGRLERITDNIAYRCCLGHGCHALSIHRRIDGTGDGILYDNNWGLAPESFVRAVGLKNSAGKLEVELEISGRKITSLVDLNDSTNMTSQEIGTWLEERINGGENTPFIALDEYPETLEKEKDE